MSENISILSHYRVISDQSGYLFADWFRETMFPVNHSCRNATFLIREKHRDRCT